MTLERVNPKNLYPGNGFAHAIVATGGRTVYVGGQVASDLDGGIVAIGDYQKQGDIALRNVAHALEAAGAAMGDLVQLNVYVVDGTPEHQKQALAGLASAAGDLGMRRTTMKVVGVQSLGSPDALVEYDAIAVVD